MSGSTTARYWIERLGLQPHPEGGYFRETYRAGEYIEAQALPPRFSGRRAHSTAIYFLLAGEDFSAFHRLKADELWHFHAGCPLRVHTIDAAGRLASALLGLDLEQGQTFQAVVPAGAWVAAELAGPCTATLVGCTVAPGFDFADFELADRAALCRRFPMHRALIERLTRVALDK